jgi:glutathione S-transferase
MLLLGRYRSPFTRRVAVSLRLLDLPYEHRPLSAWDSFEEVRAVNPLARIPALILDDGEVLYDSNAIVDYIDQLVGPERALTPPCGTARRRVMRHVALALGITEKVVAVVYERSQHAAEQVNPTWISRCEKQARSGLTVLESEKFAPWFAGDRLTQADIVTVVMYDFVQLVNPSLLLPDAYPCLEALVERAGELPAFRDTRPQ